MTMIDSRAVTMNSATKNSSSDQTGSGAETNPQAIGFMPIPEPACVDQAHSKLLGWDFREFAAFLRAQDDSWVQRTGA
jgi:hypothetical protein